MDDEERLVRVRWAGPMSVDKAEALDDGADRGVYQIYGTHPVYGAGVLLYIGKATGQTFGTRLNQEGWSLPGMTEDPGNVQVYVGRVEEPRATGEEDRTRLISAVERLLIWAHGPAYNASGVSSEPPDGVRDVRVFNTGSYRSLNPEVSGRRWCLTE